MKFYILVVFVFFTSGIVLAQNLPAGLPIIEENFRRDQIQDSTSVKYSFYLRPFDYQSDSMSHFSKFGISLGVLPVVSINNYVSNRTYGTTPFGMVPSAGFSSYLSTGVFIKHKHFILQFQPEVFGAQNKIFDATPSDWSDGLLRARYRNWNQGDYPEIFGPDPIQKFTWGQSKAALRLGAFEAGISTQNIWWGPGQWNSLLFSNNAQGFPHLTFNTYKPAKTFLGNFEAQLLVGRLESSNLPPTLNENYNKRYFRKLSTDWRYLNALLIAYTPKWIPNLSLGVGRTFQVYNSLRGDSFQELLPVFEAFQKEKFFKNGNTVEYDANSMDQQVSVSARYVAPKAKAELYFEFGRRDHAFNWREAILNPEHARAYMMGFIKLIDLQDPAKKIQVRGEMTHQQESVNIYLRNGVSRGASWHTHYQARGFSNYGQPIGVGAGIGSNVQTLEVSLVEKFNKIGLLFQRLENHQDFYYTAFGQQSVYQPWVDLSLGLLFDKQWNNLLLSSKVQLINGHNYQWQLSPQSTPEFPVGKNRFTIHSQVSLIYLPKF
jgi:hypothetical protein